MNKRTIYLLSSIIVFIILAILFFPKNKEVIEEDYISTMKYNELNEISFNNGQVSGYGISFNVPENWIEVREDKKIFYYSPEINLDSDDSRIESLISGACKVSLQIGTVEEENKSSIAQYIETLVNSPEYENTIREGESLRHEIFFLGETKGLKTIFDLREAKYILLEIPILDKIYIIESDFIFKENCLDIFNDTLETITFR